MTEAPHPKPASRRPAALALAVVMLAFAASRLLIAGVPSERENDEGIYLLSARALASGSEMFTSVFSSQPPAFLETLALTLRTFGDNLFVARAMILVFALAALFAVADLARRIAGSWAAPAAATALALTMAFGDLAHVVEAETPALAVALLSMCACLESRKRGWNRGWLLASGALFSFAALYKLIVAPLVVPLGLMLFLAPASGEETEWKLDRFRNAIGRGAILSVGAVVVLAIPLLVYDPAALYEQTIAFHLAKHDVFQLSSISNLRRAAGHLRADVALTVTALAGVALLAWRRRLLAGLGLVLWFAASVAVIALQTPVFWRHFVLLGLPASIAAGCGLAVAARELRLREGIAVPAGMLLWAALTIPGSRALFPLISDGVRRERSNASLEEAARWIRMNTSPDELVAGDDALAIYLGGRRSPPGLCDVSSARIASENLRLEEAARESLAARVLILRRDNRLSKLPGYFGWVKKNYDQRPAAYTGLGASRTVWIRRPDATADAENPPSILEPSSVTQRRDEPPGN